MKIDYSFLVYVSILQKWIKNISEMRRSNSGKWIKPTWYLMIRTRLVIIKKKNYEGRMGHKKSGNIQKQPFADILQNMCS